MRLIGVDIGGTTIKLGVFNEQGESITNKELATNGHLGGKEVLGNIMKEISLFKPFDAIGISSAGQITKDGVIQGSVNIPGLNGIRIKEILEAEFSVPVSIENDVNAAALGESYFGVGKDLSEFLFLTYGTGVGGAIIHQSKLFYGESAFAGEFGHMITHGNGIQCNCGMRGCYERYAATTALVNNAIKIDPSYNSGRIIFDKWHEADEQIVKIVDEWADEIAIGLASLIHCFNPSTIVIGGGIMEQEILIGMIQGKVDALILSSFKEVKLIKASLGNQSGMLGAVSLHLSQNNQ